MGKKILLFFVCLILCVTAAIASPSYVITDIGTLGGSTRAYAVNNSGMVVGRSYDDSTGYSSAFSWSHEAGIKRLEYWTSTANAVNVHGVAVGYTHISIARASLWGPSNVIHDLGTLGGQMSWAQDINANGVVVGSSQYNASTYRHAFIWDATHGMQDLGTLGGNESWAVGINDSGQVIGNAQRTDKHTTAFIWDSANGMRDFSNVVALSGFSTVSGINDLGQVVGNFTASDGYDHAFLWDAMHGLLDLGTLDGVSSTAYGVNNVGQVVGYSSGAFVWHNGDIRYLSDLIPTDSGWTLGSSIAINDSGQIVMSGSNGDGYSHTLLLTPVPEPSSMLALIGGTVGLGGFALRRKKK